jgi:thioredoxin reductase
MTQQDGRYDVVIVGGGAAGLSGALILGRARRSVLVVDSQQPRNAPAAHVHGFLSRDGTPPGQLLDIGRREVAGYGVEVVDGRALSAGRVSDGFAVERDNGHTVRARRLLVASGVTDELPDIPEPAAAHRAAPHGGRVGAACRARHHGRDGCGVRSGDR